MATKLTFELVGRWLSYEPAPGIVRWKRDKGPVRAGGEAGWLNVPTGYRYITIGQEGHYTHRIAWLLHYGEWPAAGMTVDHADGDKLNNRIGNLRLATRTENNWNAKKRSDNGSGVKGVDQRGGKWRARINYQRRSVFLGEFDTLEAAAAARMAATTRLHGQFANHGG